jgi:hypothetical protein
LYNVLEDDDQTNSVQDVGERSKGSEVNEIPNQAVWDQHDSNHDDVNRQAGVRGPNAVKHLKYQYTTVKSARPVINITKFCYIQ